MFFIWIEMLKFIIYGRVFCVIEDDIFEVVKSFELFSLYILVYLEYIEIGVDFYFDVYFFGELC